MDGQRYLAREGMCSGPVSGASMRLPTRAGAGTVVGNLLSATPVRKRVSVHGRVGTACQELEGQASRAQIRTRPFTGAEYGQHSRRSARSGFTASASKTMTTYPAAGTHGADDARPDDALPDPSRKDVLTIPTDTGNVTLHSIGHRAKCRGARGRS